MVSTEQMRSLGIVAAIYPDASWVIALHHHLVEYPGKARALSERIGTALINGNWFIRQLRPMAGRALLMHGHRHIDWIGECMGLLIVSAPSPVMEATDAMRPHSSTSIRYSKDPTGCSRSDHLSALLSMGSR
jgi:hypothetical protein